MSDTRKIEISHEDARQVRAILLTHAELQDRRSIPSMELMARLIAADDNDEAVRNMIESLKSQVDDFEQDVENLQRIAAFF